jgi:hypothetical protein
VWRIIGISQAGWKRKSEKETKNAYIAALSLRHRKSSRNQPQVGSISLTMPKLSPEKILHFAAAAVMPAKGKSHFQYGLNLSTAKIVALPLIPLHQLSDRQLQTGNKIAHKTRSTPRRKCGTSLPLALMFDWQGDMKDPAR